MMITAKEGWFCKFIVVEKQERGTTVMTLATCCFWWFMCQFETNASFTVIVLDCWNDWHEGKEERNNKYLDSKTNKWNISQQCKTFSYNIGNEWYECESSNKQWNVMFSWMRYFWFSVIVKFLVMLCHPTNLWLQCSESHNQDVSGSQVKQSISHNHTHQISLNNDQLLKQSLMLCVKVFQCCLSLPHSGSCSMSLSFLPFMVSQNHWFQKPTPEHKTPLFTTNTFVSLRSRQIICERRHSISIQTMTMNQNTWLSKESPSKPVCETYAI